MTRQHASGHKNINYFKKACDLHTFFRMVWLVTLIQMWVGTGCDNYTNVRSNPNQTQCEQVSPADLNVQNFITGGTNSASSLFYVTIPAQVLISPKKHGCDAAATAGQTMPANSVYI